MLKLWSSTIPSEIGCGPSEKKAMSLGTPLTHNLKSWFFKPTTLRPRESDTTTPRRTKETVTVSVSCNKTSSSAATTCVRLEFMSGRSLRRGQDQGKFGDGALIIRGQTHRADETSVRPRIK